jgi:hypothetical protein
MKQIVFFFLLLPCLASAQNILDDTVFTQRRGNLYYLVTQTTYEDSTVAYNSELLGDSTAALAALTTAAERNSNTLAIHAKPLILSAKQTKRIRLYSDLHQQISGRPVFNTTAARDTAAMVGAWRLNDTPGKIVLTPAGRLQFRPDPATATRTYTITSNLTLRTFANYVGFTVGGEAVDLYRVNEKRFSDIAGEYRLTKIE